VQEHKLSLKLAQVGSAGLVGSGGLVVVVAGATQIFALSPSIQVPVADLHLVSPYPGSELVGLFLFMQIYPFAVLHNPQYSYL
jgi:hypothetical protein